MRDYIQMAVNKAAADPEARTETLCDCSRKQGLPQDVIEMLTGYKQVACAPSSRLHSCMQPRQSIAHHSANMAIMPCLRQSCVQGNMPSEQNCRRLCTMTERRTLLRC